MWAAPATFRMEPVHGRSYVFGQWMNEEEDLQTAIESCPVDCIHWVQREELPVLEWVSANVSRVDVSTMMSGGGAVVVNPFEVSVGDEERACWVPLASGCSSVSRERIPDLDLVPDQACTSRTEHSLSPRVIYRTHSAGGQVVHQAAQGEGGAGAQAEPRAARHVQ